MLWSSSVSVSWWLSWSDTVGHQLASISSLPVSLSNGVFWLPVFSTISSDIAITTSPWTLTGKQNFRYINACRYKSLGDFDLIFLYLVIFIKIIIYFRRFAKRIIIKKCTRRNENCTFKNEIIVISRFGNGP